MFNRGAIGFGLDFQYVGQTTDNTTRSTYTFSSHDLGTPHPERMVVVIAQLGGTSPAVSSMTVAGTTLTNATGVGLAGVRQVIRYAKIPAGSTGDIVVNVTGTVTTCRVAVYRFNTAVTTTLDAVSNSATGTSVSADDVECVSGGVVICAGISDINQTITGAWNGADTLTQDYSTGGLGLARFAGNVLTNEDIAVNDFSISVPSSDSLVVSAASFAFSRG
ncbi:MAG: hypothetical protein EP323_00380 [Gammaproteobacteria bacterium]|nr:MAG: hypothetical protein EP323_00380 [Gammaproteobacteria bacterium]